MNKQRKVLITTTYNEMGIVIDTKAEEVAQPEVEKDTNVPINDCISRRAAIRWVKTECNPYGNPTLDFESGKKVIEHLEQMPSAQPEPISEEYAKAVRTWLINYQVRCAELMGRYTPYEILGWIVSDWRKENEIW